MRKQIYAGKGSITLPRALVCPSLHCLVGTIID